ncbi:hypothetical protein FD19_GL000355 [Lacticaseibacillus thailandensis DSM 22698 = JCM 13996]|uniref:Uncharacterized protein n=1 Tax=Lacticaseibacillus thailandensis DSM 22698 = JCM 13996 TaxID=1423810 RepID=A0A0R2C9M4_9LACO|nr:hypothetical protein FD19_GL000355 [Lacticaseibacillus thailandensis DSM 22698 = JCM 13996]
MVTSRDEPYVGVSGSRQSIANVMLKIVADPTDTANNSIGIAGPDTAGENRPIY